MPFLPTDDQDQNQQNKDAGEGSQAAGGQILSGPSSAPIQGGQAFGNTAGKGTSSGTFTNLNNYVNANQGNDAAMGAAVGNTVANAANQADQAGSQFKDATESKIEQNTIRDTSGLTDTFKGLAATKGPNTQQSFATTRQFAAPTQTTSKGRGGQFAVPTEQKDVTQTRSPAESKARVAALDSISQDDFNRLYSGNYAGPKNLADESGYADTKNAFNKAQTLGQMAGGAQADMASRGQLLENTFSQGGQQYRKGEKTLDSFILGAGQGGQQALQDIGAKYGNYGDNFSSLENMLAGKSAAADAETQANSQAFRDAVASANKTIGDRLQAAKKTAAAKTAADSKTLAALQAGNADAWAPYVSRDVLKYMTDHGVDLGSVASGNTQYSAADLADEADVNDFSSLEKLLSGAGAATNNNINAADLTRHAGAGIDISSPALERYKSEQAAAVKAQQEKEAQSPFGNTDAYSAGGHSGFKGAGYGNDPLSDWLQAHSDQEKQLEAGRKQMGR